MSENISSTTPDQPTPPDKKAPALPARRRSKAPTIIATVALVVLLVIGIWALFIRDSGSAGAAGGVVRLGTTDAAQPHWEILKDLAAEEDITLEIVEFSEYTLPNPSLADGELDLNAFQHILYLADHNNNTGDDLQPIGSTLIVPLPLYSEKYASVEEFQPGDQVAIPNDATNQARALFVLEAAGLIAFTGEPSVPTPDDVDASQSTVVVRPVEASQTAGLIRDPDVAGVVVNNNFATDAGFDLQGYVYADDPSSEGAKPYINVIVARPGEADNPTYQKIVELYHDPTVLDSVVESSGGTAVIVEGYDAADLRQILDDTAANLRG